MNTEHDVAVVVPGYPMEIAQHLVDTVFTFPGGVPSLIRHQGSWWEYAGSRWSQRDDEWIMSRLHLELKDLYVEVVDANNRKKTVKFGPNTKSVGFVINALKSLLVQKHTELPVFLRGGEGFPNPHNLIAFRDQLVEVPGLRTWTKGPEWFDVTCVPCDYDPAAACPTWLRCVEQWGCGDPAWSTLLQRWFGYCLMNHRDYAKWLLLFGKSRAGKGTIVRILSDLIGWDAFLSAQMTSFNGEHGLVGLENARVLSITEAGKPDGRDADRLAELMKRIVGGDPMHINPKYKDPVRNVVVKAAPMVQANEMPRLPDRGGGISTKMLMLPFNWSTRDPGSKEDVNLIGKLRAELPGIAAWALQGARHLVAADAAERWPTPEGAPEVMEAYRAENSPMDGFLAEYFVPNPSGFVLTEVIYERYALWARQQDVRFPVPRQFFSRDLVENTSWPIARSKPRGEEGRKRGFKGISLRSDR